MTSFTNTTLNYPTGANTPIRRVKTARAPLSSDFRNFIPGDEWLDTSGHDWWKFVGYFPPTINGLWVLIGANSGVIESLSDTANTPVFPSSNVSVPPNNIQLINQDGGLSIVSDPSNNRILLNLTGGGEAIDEILVDTFSNPGTNPVVPTVAGRITVTGGQVAAGTTANVIQTDSLAANTYTIEIQRSQAVATSTVGDNGVAHFNSATSSVDANGFMSPFMYARWVVNPIVGLGTHTTIQAAITAASSGEDIFVSAGTYTEDPILKAGVNLVAFLGDELTPNVTIVGKVSFSSAGNVNLSCIRLQTNADYALEVTGAAGSNVELEDCYINATNNTAIHITATGATINVYDCTGNIGTTGIGMWDMTGNSAMSFVNCSIGNTGQSVTASTNSIGAVNIQTSNFNFPISTTGTGGIGFNITLVDCGNVSPNVTSVTANGTGTSNARNSTFGSGSQSAISIGVGATFTIGTCNINSTNTNAIAGAGTLIYGGLTFLGSSSQLQNTLTLSLLGDTPSNATSGFVWTSTGNFTSPTWQANAGGTAIQNIAGNTGTASGTTVTIKTPSTSGDGTAVFTASGSTSTLTFTSGNNLGIGTNALAAITVGSGNTVFGALSGGAIINASSNSIVGEGSGNLITSSPTNTGVGQGCFASLATGSGRNDALGSLALSGLTTGTRNIGIGYSSGSSFTTSESSNIVIGNTGTILDSNTIRLGTHGSGTGQQSTCFIAGIDGNNVNPTLSRRYVQINSTSHQLGASALIADWTITSGTFGPTNPNQGYILNAASTYTMISGAAIGSWYQFACNTASSVVITAPGGAFIRIGSSLSSSGGTITSNTIGNSIYLVYDGATTWFSVGAPQGTWAVA